MKNRSKALFGLTSLLALGGANCMVARSPEYRSSEHRRVMGEGSSGDNGKNDWVLPLNDFAYMIGTWTDSNGNNAFDFDGNDSFTAIKPNEIPSNKNVVLGGAYRRQIEPVPSVRLIDGYSRAREKSLEILKLNPTEENKEPLNFSWISFMAGELEPGNYTAVYSQRGVDFRAIPIRVIGE